jgi:hypothetical protein
MSSYYYERETLAPEGLVVFTITGAEERTSLNGNKYLRLKFKDLVSRGTFYESVSLGAKSAWKLFALFDSVGLTVPEGGFELSSGDFENRGGYAIVKHVDSTKSDKVFAEVDKFLTREAALALDPSLADVEFPEDTLTEVETLRPARVRGSRRQTRAVAVEEEVDLSDVGF